MKKLDYKSKKEGFTVLYAVIIVSMVVAIGTGVFSMTTRQSQLVGLGSGSFLARNATDRAVECFMYNDIVSGVVSGPGSTINCEDSVYTAVVSNRAEYELDVTILHSDSSCAIVSFDDDFEGKKRIYTRGFNRCSGAGPVAGDPSLREYVYEVVYEGAAPFSRQQEFGDENDPAQVTKDLEIYDGYLYAAENAGLIRIYSLASPDNPVEVATYMAGGVIDEIFISDGILYVGTNDVEIVDISVPTNPVSLSKIEDVFSATGLYKIGDYLYVGNKHFGFRTYDVSDLDSPVFLTNYDPTNIAIKRILVSGDHAYVCGIRSDFVVIDVSTPQSPVEEDSIGTSGDCVDNMIKKGDYVIVPWGDRGFRVIDVEDPSSIATSVTVVPPAVKEGQNTAYPNVLDLALEGDLLYVAASLSFYIYDVSDPTNPQLFYEDNPSGGVDVSPRAVAISGGHAYLADSDGGILHYGTSDEVLTIYSDR